MGKFPRNIDYRLNLEKSITSRFSDISNFGLYRGKSINPELNYTNSVFNSIIQYLHSNKLDINPESIKYVLGEYLTKRDDGDYYYEILRITMNESQYKLVIKKLLDYCNMYDAILSSQEVR